MLDHRDIPDLYPAARPPMPEPPAASTQETAQTHGGRILAYVLEYGRPAVWRASDVALERALSFSLIAMTAPDMLDRARDRIVDARRMIVGELHARQEKAARDAREAARLAAQPGPRSSFPGSQDDDDGGRHAPLQPRPRTNPPTGAMVRDLNF